MKTPMDEEDLPQPLPLDDPDLNRIVDRTLLPLAKTFSQRKLEAYRLETLRQMSVNPQMIALVRNIKRPKVAESGTEAVHTPSAEEPLRSSGGGSKGELQ
ncbi:MAG: hypothetical protein HUU21_15945 [Polyangiaceae bacterium]|nr:hypothetical protein [Polyangiaceae bacterium]NUQ75043.1 hypothetical protein [Polyangiaceae bacterium]